MLTEDQIRFFREHGYLRVGRVLDDAELEALRRHVEWIASGEAAHIPTGRLQVEPRVAQGERTAENYELSLRKMYHLAWHDSMMLDHARRPSVVTRMQQLLGPDLKLYQDQLFMKPPQIGSRQAYHQDQPLGFWIAPLDRLITCWTALDPSTRENGCLWVIPGSHIRGALSRAEMQEYEARALAGELEAQVPLELQPGEASFHHGHLLHCSGENRSGRRRRGYATHYVSGRCRYTGPEPKEEFPLIAGRDYPDTL